MARIIVGIDGSEESREALRFAVELAACRHGEVMAVHAYPPLVVTHPYAYWGEAYLPAPDHDVIQERAETTLRDTVAEVVGPDPQVKVLQEAVPGLAAQVLVDHGRGADMIVVGSRGLGSFRGMILGSVSHKVATHATCPVVVMPGHHER